MKKHYLLIIVILLLCIPKYANAIDEYTLSHIGYSQGLSNSAVLSLYKDNQGFMWFGTYDGLNNYDGKNMAIYRTDMNVEKQLLNNVIYHVNAADNNCLWISTNTGINRFSIKQKTVTESYESFKNDFILHSNRKGDTWLIDKDDIYVYEPSKSTFQKTTKKSKAFNKELSFVDDKGYLWLFSTTNNSIYKCHANHINNPKQSYEIVQTNIHNKKIEYTFYQEGLLSFIDQDKDLFLFDLTRNTKIFIRNVGELIAKYGKITGIISFYDDIVIAFIQNGLIKLDSSSHYSESVIDRSVRIFSIYKDPMQEIIWVATDGQGVMAYSKKKSIASHFMFNHLQNKITRQVRSIYTDKKGDLWFGTKGDGLVKIENYMQHTVTTPSLNAISIYFPGNKANLPNYHRELTEFQVFGIVPSRYMNGFWIGSAENPGLSYYDYQKDNVIAVSGDTKLLQRVHRIYEQNDTTLWLTTSGNGVCRVHLDKTNGIIKAKKTKQYIFNDGKKNINDFFPMLVEGDSVIWLGSRGMGLVKFNIQTLKHRVFLLGNKDKFAINDILSIYRKQNTFYLGTVSGLVRLTFNASGTPKVFCIGKEQGFLNDMIHGILEDENGFLWLSTNKGLVKYNPTNNVFHTYYYNNGLQIGEFSDDAFYKCPYTGNLFFGGIDGLLYLEKKRMNEVEYHPDIYFRDLTIGVETDNFNAYYDLTSNTLSLKGIHLSFALSFIAPDFIDGDNFEYSYKLEGRKGTEWSPFTPDNKATFNALPHGYYTLKIRYKKDIFDTEYKSYSLNIHILPPWYLSIWAYLGYCFFAIVAIIYTYHMTKRYYRRGRLIKKLMLRESHNTSQTGINQQTHETVGLLSKICHTCEQLRQIDSMSIEYYKMLDTVHDTVLSVAFKSESISEEYCDLGTYLPREISVYGTVNLKKLSDEIIGMLIYRNHDGLSDLEIELDNTLDVYLPKQTLGYILYYLYAEAATAKTKVIITSNLTAEGLIIELTVPHDIADKILQVNNYSSPRSENQSMHYFHKWLYLYAMKVMNGVLRQKEQNIQITFPVMKKKQELPIEVKTKKTILLLEDKEEIIWLMNDLLSDNYNIHAVQTIQEAFGYLKKNSPEVFMPDTMIYQKEEDKFMEYIQSHKGLLIHTAFIPILKWKATFLLHKELQKLADGFVIMPYNILFVKEIIDLAVNRQTDRKEVILVDLPGQKEKSIICETPEQATFAKQLLAVLDANLDKEDLNTSFIAEKMNISSRQYYRKFKEISHLSPTDFIKNYRIEKAACLLAETDWSVQKVISEVGIQSRSYFYKEFSSRYGVTPRIYKQNCPKKEFTEE